MARPADVFREPLCAGPPPAGSGTPNQEPRRFLSGNGAGARAAQRRVPAPAPIMRACACQRAACGIVRPGRHRNSKTGPRRLPHPPRDYTCRAASSAPAAFQFRRATLNCEQAISLTNPKKTWLWESEAQNQDYERIILKNSI